MAVDDDKSTSGDNIKVPKFDHSNKTVSRDSRIRAYTQSFKCAAMTKYGTAVGALFQPLAITKAGATPPSLHFAKKGKIAKVAPAFYKMVQHNEVEAWFKMQVWMLHYLIRDFKESDGAIIDAHVPEVFKTRLLDEGWEPDSNHVAFAPFATAYFHITLSRPLLF